MEDILSQLTSLKADYSAATELLEVSAKQVEDLKAQLAALTTEVEQARQASDAKDTSLAHVAAQLAASEAEIATLKASQKTAEEKAVALVATQGVAPIAVTHSTVTASREDVVSEWLSIKDAKARAQFYAANKHTLLGP